MLVEDKGLPSLQRRTRDIWTSVLVKEVAVPDVGQGVQPLWKREVAVSEVEQGIPSRRSGGV